MPEMSSPPQNNGSDAEDGEVSESGDEAVGKDTKDSSNPSALPAGQNEEENGEDSSPQRKVLFPQRCISVYFNHTLLYFKIPNSIQACLLCSLASLLPHNNAFGLVLLMLSCYGMLSS